MVRLILSYVMHAYRPKISLEKTPQIMRFSKWILADGIVNFANTRADIIVLGKFFDTATLGLYSVAHEIATLAATEIVAPIQRALLAGLSKLNDDPDALRTAFMEAQGIIILLGLPVAAGIGVTADPLVRLTLGENWLSAIPLIQIMAFIGIARVSLASTNPLFLATSQPQLKLIISVLGAVFGIPLLIWATLNWGVFGTAYALTATAFLKLAVNVIILARRFDITARQLVPSIWRPLVACAAMAMAVWRYFALWDPSDILLANVTALLSASIIGAAIYVAVILGLWWLSGAPKSAEHRILTLLGGAVTRLRSRPLAI